MNNRTSPVYFFPSRLPSDWTYTKKAQLEDRIRREIEIYVAENAASESFWAMLNAANETPPYLPKLPEDLPKEYVPPWRKEDVQIDEEAFDLIRDKAHPDLVRSGAALSWILSMRIAELRNITVKDYWSPKTRNDDE